MATFTLLVSRGEPYWLRVETPATNERDLVKFLMDSWSKDQCHLNFLETFLNEHSPEALTRIFPEGSDEPAPASVAASVTASVNSERSHPSHSSSMLDDDELDDEEKEKDDSDEDKEGPPDDDEEEEEDEEDSLDSDDETDIIMTPANTYKMTSIQRVMFIDEIQEACQPVPARKRFFEMCRQNTPSIVFIKPDGLL